MIIDCHAHAVPLEVANIFQKLELRSPRQGHWNEKERLDLMDIWIFSKSFPAERLTLKSF